MLKFKVSAFCVVFASIFAVVSFIGCDGNSGTGLDNFTYTGRTVEIGNLTWMAENLNRNTNNSWCYDNNSSNCAIYGRLYTWDAAMRACPSGWRLPTNSDWNNLFEATGGISVAAGKLKSRTGWNNNGNGTDDFGFSALPGGDSWGGDSFSYIGGYGIWWSATEVTDHRGAPTFEAHLYEMYSSAEYVVHHWRAKSYFGLSVRCVK